MMTSRCQTTCMCHWRILVCLRTIVFFVIVVLFGVKLDFFFQDCSGVTCVLCVGALVLVLPSMAIMCWRMSSTG
jgi:hypothetical protein